MSRANRKMGQVKWFNNKAGYGFITMTESGTDIFTHYSTVHVQDTQYKFLVQGEYVEFDLVDSTSENHKFQATNVTGMHGGKLMCETRQMNRTAATVKRVVVPPSLVADDSEGDFKPVVNKRVMRNKKV
jgi:CspA family cold shock protein